MRTLLLAWLAPQCADHGRVCVLCGLEYPCYRKPPLSTWPVRPGQGPQQGPVTDFFASCPSCGASTREIDWPWLVKPNTYPWQQDG
jgi:hypothetical protein